MFLEFKLFVKRNQVLTALFLVASGIIVSYYVTQDMFQSFPKIKNLYQLAADLSIGVIINLIFYIFQVYIPRLEEEKNSLSIINADLSKICDNIQQILLVLQVYLQGFNSGKFAPIKKKTVYFMLTTDSNLSAGFTRRFDLCNDFSPLAKSIVQTTDKLLSSFAIQGCGRDVIDLLGKLQQNGFLKALEFAESDGYDPQCHYGDLEKYYQTFFETFKKLKGFANGYQEKFIRPLTDVEIKFFEDRMRTAPQGKPGIPYVYINSNPDPKV